MATEFTNWIIGVSGSEMDDVYTYRVSGTLSQVKKHLVALVKEDRRTNREDEYATWDFGTTSIKDVEERSNGKLYAYGCWDSFHNDYTATPEMPVKALE